MVIPHIMEALDSLAYLSSSYPHGCLVRAGCLGSSPTAGLGCLPVGVGCQTQHFFQTVGKQSFWASEEKDGAWGRGKKEEGTILAQPHCGFLSVTSDVSPGMGAPVSPFVCHRIGVDQSKV